MALDSFNQPMPIDIPGAVDVNDWLLGYIDLRAKLGEEKYKLRLKEPNGRDPDLDRLDELLDAAVYTVQAHLEKKRLLAELQEYYERYGPLPDDRNRGRGY